MVITNVTNQYYFPLGSIFLLTVLRLKRSCASFFHLVILKYGATLSSEITCIYAQFPPTIATILFRFVLFLRYYTRIHKLDRFKHHSDRHRLPAYCTGEQAEHQWNKTHSSRFQLGQVSNLVSFQLGQSALTDGATFSTRSSPVENVTLPVALS